MYLVSNKQTIINLKNKIKDGYIVYVEISVCYIWFLIIMYVRPHNLDFIDKFLCKPKWSFLHCYYNKGSCSAKHIFSHSRNLNLLNLITHTLESATEASTPKSVTHYIHQADFRIIYIWLYPTLRISYDVAALPHVTHCFCAWGISTYVWYRI